MHTVNMLDIYHPAQHLVFVFSMAQNGSLRGLSVCATSPVLGMRKWTEVAQRTPCTLHAESAGDRVSLLPGIERALNSIVILLLRSSRERRHCFAHYDESIHSVRFFVLPRNPRHAWAIAVGRPCLSPACVDSRDLYPVELRASGKKKSQTKKIKQQSILHRRGGDREQETLCHCRVRDYKLNCAPPGDTSAQKLPASYVAQERGAEQERRMWRGKESPASSTINLSLCVCVSQKNVAVLIWLLLRLSVGGPIRLRCVWIDHFHAIPVHTIFFSYLIMPSNEFSKISATCFRKLITSCCGSTSATTFAQLPNFVDSFWMTKG